jgi:hypothetical protein
VLVITLFECVLQAVGASGAAALRPTLHKAAGRGVDSVRRAVLMSAEQSKHTLCVALLREVCAVAPLAVKHDTAACTYVWKYEELVCHCT